MQIRSLFLVIIIALIAGACSSDEEVSVVDYGYEYFPLEIGQYRHYDVTEIIYTSQGGDTSVYQLREYIIDTIHGGAEVTFLIERSKRSNGQNAWQVDSVWSARRTNDHAVVIENNVPLLKVSFPVQDSLTWNGNSFNSKDPDQYQMFLLPSDTSANELLQVTISDIPENLVLQDQRYEYYMKSIGLIEKDYVTLNFCTTGCEFTGQILSGRILKQKIFEYGTE